MPLPDEPARDALLQKLLPDGGRVKIRLSSSDRRTLLRLTEGYSCSDLNSLAKEAAMGPVRDLDLRGGRNLTPSDVRHIELRDFRQALSRVKPTVSAESLAAFEAWDT